MTIVLTAPSSFPNSFALEGYYEPAVREINHQPTICIFEPDDYRVDEKTWKRWLSDSKAAIDEWESILKQRSTFASAKWNIEVVEIPKEKQFLYNPTGCTIEVYYTDYVSEEFLGALGWYWVGTGIIEIVFVQTDFCGRISYYGFYLDYYCYGDNLERPKKMAAVLQHELGHAFGLGHYLPYTQEQLDDWQEHPLGQPSIMSFAHHNEEQMKIQKLDIDKIFEVYSAMGFGRDKNENPVFIEIEPEEPELDFDFSGNVQQVIVERGKIVTQKISGYVPEFLYSRGMPVEFQMEFPDSSVHESAIVVTGHKYYEVPLPFSWESQRGEYKIIVRYDGLEIQTAILNVGEKSSSTIVPKSPDTPITPSYDLPVTLTTFTNSEYGFSILYPSGWFIDDAVIEFEPLPGSDDGGASIVVFYDDPEFWNNSIEVMHIKNDNIARNNDGQNYLSRVVILLTENCEVATFDFEGYLCSNHSVLSSKVSSINGKPAYKITESWTQTFADGSVFENTSILTDIVDGNDVWTVDVISTENEFLKMEKTFIQIIDSFKLSQDIPDWIKNNARWWSEGQIGDSDFVGGIQYMIKEKIINIPDLPEQSSETAEEKVPDWIRNNAGWWADGLISEEDFLNGIKYLVEKGIIRV